MGRPRTLLASIAAVAVALGGVPASVADEEPLAAACADAPAGRFADVSGVHAAGIDCIGWWGVTQGTGDGSYLPGEPVNRAQMATFVARAIELSGGQLPVGPPAAFDDTAGNVHAANIDALAALGVVGGVGDGLYAPDRVVTRGQMATFLAGAWQARTGEELAAGQVQFDDIEGNVHAEAIAAITAVGWTGGTAPGIYEPGLAVTRAQMGTFLARWLTTLVEDGHATYPPASPSLLCAGLEEPVTRESDVVELVSALEAAADGGVASAGVLAQRIGAVEPAPRSPWEALGRLWWDGGDDPGTAMLAIDRQVEESCDRPLVDGAFLDGFEEAGPRPLGDNRVRLGSYGRPCSTRTWQGYWTADQQPFSEDGIVVMHCDDPPAGSGGLTIDLLDLENGVVSTLPVPSGNDWRGGPGQGTWPWVTGGWMYWIEDDELPTSGLDPARERARLFRASVERPTEPELLWTVEDEDRELARLEIVGAYEGKVLVLDGVYEPEATLRVFGPDGAPIASAPGHISRRPVIAWPGVVQYGEVIVDLEDASMRAVEPVDTFKDEPSLQGPLWHRDACTGARFEHAFDPSAPLRQWVLGPGRVLTSTELAVDGRLPGRTLVPLGDGFVTMPTRGLSGSYAHYGAEGELLWEIPDGVVDRAQVVAGQLFVVTVSDELVAVDNATGGEAEADPQLLELARTLLDGGSVWIDPATGEAEVRSGDVLEFVELEACASG